MRERPARPKVARVVRVSVAPRARRVPTAEVSISSSANGRRISAAGH
jgi:hypothetical protein